MPEPGERLKRSIRMPSARPITVWMLIAVDEARDVLRFGQGHSDVGGKCPSVVDVLGVEHVGPEGVEVHRTEGVSAVKSR